MYEICTDFKIKKLLCLHITHLSTIKHMQESDISNEKVEDILLKINQPCYFCIVIY